MRKIVIIYASAGEGHKKAAFAIYEQLRKQSTSDTHVTLIDSLDYANAFFKFVYKMGYIFMVKYMSTIWGFCYYLLDNKFFFTLNQPFRILVNTLNTRKLVAFLKKENFDTCVSTHFLATEVVSRMKKEGKINARLITLITDYKSHLFWQTKQVDTYVVGSEDTKQNLISRGVDESIIKAYGIPIDPKFSIVKTKEEIVKKLRLADTKFTVLVMGGGFGVGPIKEIVTQLQQLKADFQILVVCGHNEDLFKDLSALKPKFSKPTTVFGFCNNMDEIMYLSDIMISKVGGMSSTESFVSDLIIVAISPIPGQEMRNAKFLLRNEAGFMIKKPQEAVSVVADLTSDEAKMSRIKEKIKKIAKPNAAKDIANLALHEA